MLALYARQSLNCWTLERLHVPSQSYASLHQPPNVVEQLEKLRQTLNLWKVNKHLIMPKLRYEGLERLAELVAPGYWTFSTDSKSSYHHVDVHLADRQYLGFQVHGVSYMFNLLLYGLVATMPYACTHVIKQLAARWHSLGLRPIPSFSCVVTST